MAAKHMDEHLEELSPLCPCLVIDAQLLCDQSTMPTVSKAGGKFAKCPKYQIPSVAANRCHVMLLFMML